ncbi:MAG: mechanosensitive ion channel, partial [Chromatiales bacterium]
RLLDALRAFDSFLNEHLLWLRSSAPTHLEDLRQLPNEVRQLVSTAISSDLAPLFVDQVILSPLFWVALALAILLLWQHRRLIKLVEDTAKRLGKPTTDSFSYTLQALALTLIVALPLPLLLVVTGWQFQVAPQATDLSHALGASLYRTALHIYILRTLYALCLPRGLAAAHFRWPESSLALMRAELDRLTWIFVPASFIVRLAVDLNPGETGGTTARLAVLIGYAAVTFFLYRVLHPKQGVLAHLRLRQGNKGLLFRTYPIWYLLLLACPPALVSLALAGFMYSAAVLSFMYLYTLWMILGLVLLHALVRRWLLVVRRRLVYEAALERRKAAIAARQAEAAGSDAEEDAAMRFEEPEVDLTALSHESEELVKIATVAAVLLGVYMIWSSVLPALRIFDDITLWHYTVTLDGEDQRLPVTLADIGLALIYVIAIAVLAKRLPSVLEIILLQRFDMSSGSRYTAITLTNYGIIAVGILLVFNTIGAQWSQLQWLVAALGVGIGFGLQEIVANFISGLIILFERPIRVGDIVTVGDTDGLVTKIRIRATTIRNWDRKELLVPNKEFITGRLLNWSLSDQITRIVIVAGIAYGSDVDKALALMNEAAEEHENVLDDPPPIVTFEGFGDNALTLILRAFVESIDHRLSTTTDLHKAINRKFEQAGIVIAFPQRDLHIDNREPLRISIEEAG